jgi:hypothetical protein
MADKYLYNNAGAVTEKAAIITSAGAGDSGKIPALDASGKFDSSFMPTGIAADTAAITASEALAAGDLVNIWNSTGAKVRKADATVSGKEAHGFVLASVSNGATATVYFEGTNTGVTSLTPGVQYLSTTAGLCTATAPSGSGNVVQRVGFATSATALNMQSMPPIVLA